MKKQLVNPIALLSSVVKYSESTSPVLDISFLRVVVKDEEEFKNLNEGDDLTLRFLLDRYQFQSEVTLKTRGDGWLRFTFGKIVPSSKAHLRSFLCPKKVGESIVEDWRNDRVRHYHGLNECELWFDDSGAVCFTYLDPENCDYQFIFKFMDVKGIPQVGKIARKDYVELNRLDSEIALLPLTDREIYATLSETRDIITNFRPTGQLEYHLKQRLLKVISESLYSTSRRVEMTPTKTSNSPQVSV